MDRLQYYILLVVSMSSSAHKCKQQSAFPLFDFQNFQLEGSSAPYTRFDTKLRVSQIPSDPVKHKPLEINETPIRRKYINNYLSNDRMYDRSIEVDKDVGIAKDHKESNKPSEINDILVRKKYINNYVSNDRVHERPIEVGKDVEIAKDHKESNKPSEINDILVRRKYINNYVSNDRMYDRSIEVGKDVEIATGQKESSRPLEINDILIRRKDINNYVSNDRVHERPIEVGKDVEISKHHKKSMLKSESKVQKRSWPFDNNPYTIVNMYPLPHPSGSKRTGLKKRLSSHPEDSVLLPRLTSPYSYSQQLEVAEDCRNVGICKNVPNYPTELVEKLLKKHKLKGIYHVEQPDPPVISHRYGENSLCPFKKEIYFPQQAQDRNNKWWWIVNTDKNQLQGYKVEICAMNATCILDGATISNFTYNTTCIQKYIDKTLVAVDADNNKFHHDIFKIPTSCDCFVRDKYKTI